MVFSSLACQAEPPTKTDGTFAFPGFSGWKPEAQPTRLDAANLYKIIDGEAEIFLQYNVQFGLFGNYTPKNGSSLAIDVECYKMDTHLNAFGIYSVSHSSQGKPAGLGSEGVIGSTQLTFFKNTWFVRMTVSKASDEASAALAACGKAFADAIPGNIPSLTEPNLVTIPGVEPASIQYVAKNVLDIPFLERGIIGEVAADAVKARLVVLLCGSVEKATETFRKFAEYIHTEGTVLGDAKAVPLQGTLPMLNGILLGQQGSYVIAVVDLEKPEAGLPILSTLTKQVESQIKK